MSGQASGSGSSRLASDPHGSLAVHEAGHVVAHRVLVGSMPLSARLDLVADAGGRGSVVVRHATGWGVLEQALAGRVPVAVLTDPRVETFAAVLAAGHLAERLWLADVDAVGRLVDEVLDEVVDDVGSDRARLGALASSLDEASAHMWLRGVCATAADALRRERAAIECVASELLDDPCLTGEQIERLWGAA